MPIDPRGRIVERLWRRSRRARGATGDGPGAAHVRCRRAPGAARGDIARRVGKASTLRPRPAAAATARTDKVHGRNTCSCVDRGRGPLAMPPRAGRARPRRRRGRTAAAASRPPRPRPRPSTPASSSTGRPSASPRPRPRDLVKTGQRQHPGQGQAPAAGWWRHRDRRLVDRWRPRSWPAPARSCSRCPAATGSARATVITDRPACQRLLGR